MKHRVRLAFYLAAILNACSSPSTAPPEGGADQSISVEARAGLRELRIPDDNVRRAGDEIVVDGDVVFDRAMLEAIGRSAISAAGDSGRAHQASMSSSRIPRKAQPTLIRVSVGQIATSPEWLQATRDAIAYFNSTAGVSFSMQESEVSPDIRVEFFLFQFDGSQNVYADAFAPNGDAFGAKVRINTDGPPSPTQDTRLRVMVHEFGHTLGFRHTNWDEAFPFAPAETADSFGVVQIPGTPNRDSLSIMNRFIPNGFTGWSFFDLVAIRYLYPTNTPTVSYANVGGAASLSWSPQPAAADYTIVPYNVGPFFQWQPQYSINWPTQVPFATAATTYSHRRGGFPSSYGPFRGKFTFGSTSVPQGATCFVVRTRYAGGVQSFGEATAQLPYARRVGCFW